MAREVSCDWSAVLRREGNSSAANPTATPALEGFPKPLLTTVHDATKGRHHSREHLRSEQHSWSFFYYSLVLFTNEQKLSRSGPSVFSMRMSGEEVAKIS